MAAEELLKDFVLLRRDLQKVNGWAESDLRVAESGLQYHQEQVNQLADEAYNQRWRRGQRESERAIASLQGLGHKRATLWAIREERDVVTSYLRSCRCLANTIFLRVLVSRFVEEKLEQDTTQVTCRIFSYLDEIQLSNVRDLFDDIYTGWLSFIEAYSQRAYSGYGRTGHPGSTCSSGRAMPSYLHGPRTGGLAEGAHGREPRGPSRVRFGATDQQ